MAARRSHLTATVLPALAGGQWVVCDRFADSTMAYQGYAGGVPLADLAALQRIAAGELAPDLTLILDLPVERGLARQAEWAADCRIEFVEPAFAIDGSANVAAAHRHFVGAFAQHIAACPCGFDARNCGGDAGVIVERFVDLVGRRQIGMLGQGRRGRQKAESGEYDPHQAILP